MILSQGSRLRVSTLVMVRLFYIRELVKLTGDPKAFFWVFFDLLCFFYVICSVRTNLVLVWILFTVDVGACLVTAAFFYKAAGSMDIALKCQIVRRIHSDPATDICICTNRRVLRVAVLSYSLAVWVDGTCCWPCCFQRSSFHSHFQWATYLALFRVHRR